MTDLFLHIGLSKTGTTTLQNDFFCHYTNYFGRIQNRKHAKTSHVYIYELRRILNLIYKNKDYHVSTCNWIENVLAYKNKYLKDSNSIIISDEALSGIGHPFALKSLFHYTKIYNRFNIHKSKLPICEALSIFSQYYWTFGNVRVILTLRNQAEWLASFYAQKTALLLRPSQDKFIKFINNTMQHKAQPLDWSRWISELQTAVGKDNVCPLLIEDINTTYYWNKLTEFLNKSKQKNNNLYSINFQKRNTRGDHSFSWHIRPLHKKVLKRRLKTVLKENQSNFRMNLIYNLSLPFVSIVDPVLYVLFNVKRNKYIYLTHDLQHKIQVYLSQPNINLSYILAQNLDKKGY